MVASGPPERPLSLGKESLKEKKEEIISNMMIFDEP